MGTQGKLPALLEGSGCLKLLSVGVFKANSLNKLVLQAPGVEQWWVK